MLGAEVCTDTFIRDNNWAANEYLYYGLKHSTGELSSLGYNSAKHNHVLNRYEPVDIKIDRLWKASPILLGLPSRLQKSRS